MDNKKMELSQYRMNRAQETLQVARECYRNQHYRDAMNRSYYAAFYGLNGIKMQIDKSIYVMNKAKNMERMTAHVKKVNALAKKKNKDKK